MLLTSRVLARSVVQRAVVASVLVAAASAASAALPQFTFSPSAIGASLAGTPNIAADNILVSDYATVLFDSPTHFTDQGFLSVTGFQLGSTTLTPAGLHSTYGLYIAFSGDGNGDVLSSLNYTLYGYVGGPASFGFSGNTTTVTTANPAVALAHGSLISGKTFGDASFNGAYAALTVSTLKPSFFTLPSPSFYARATTAFVNSGLTIQPLANGFQVSQGGGTLAFAVPEPETYALMLCGLATVGFAVRRRKSRQDQA